MRCSKTKYQLQSPKEDVAVSMVLTNLTTKSKVPKTTQLVFKDKNPQKN